MFKYRFSQRLGSYSFLSSDASELKARTIFLRRWKCLKLLILFSIDACWWNERWVCQGRSKCEVNQHHQRFISYTAGHGSHLRIGLKVYHAGPMRLILTNVRNIEIKFIGICSRGFGAFRSLFHWTSTALVKCMLIFLDSFFMVLQVYVHLCLIIIWYQCFFNKYHEITAIIFNMFIWVTDSHRWRNKHLKDFKAYFYCATVKRMPQCIVKFTSKSYTEVHSQLNCWHYIFLHRITLFNTWS